MEKIRNFFKDEAGASMVEYGLLVALIAIVAAVGVTSLGTQINTKFGAAATTDRQLRKRPPVIEPDLASRGRKRRSVMELIQKFCLDTSGALDAGIRPAGCLHCNGVFHGSDNLGVKRTTTV